MGPSPELIAAARASYRRMVVSAIAIAVTALTLLVWFCILVNAVASRTERLDRVGIPVDGVVIGYDYNFKSNPDLWVSYVVEGRRTTSEISDFTGPRATLRRGAPVTVLIDPEDHTHVSLPGQDNQSRSSVVLMCVLLVVGLIGAIFGVWSLINVGRARRCLGRTDWTAVDASTTLSPNLRRAAPIEVSFASPDGPRLAKAVGSFTPWPFPSVRSSQWFKGGKTWVTGNAIVLLLPPNGPPVVAKLRSRPAKHRRARR